MEAKLPLRGFRQLAPVFQRCLKKPEGADNVGFNKLGRSIDRPVDMCFSCQMNDAVDALPPHQLAERGFIADIGIDEAIVRSGFDGSQRGQIAGIGEFIDIDDGLADLDEMPAQGRTNETCTTRNEDVHSAFSSAMSKTSAVSRDCAMRSLSES